MDNLPYEIDDSNLTSHASLAVIAEVIEQLQLASQVGRIPY